MLDDPVLVNDWHPVARVDQLAGGGPLGARLLGEDIVLWRSGSDYFAWRDLCVHRGTRLSLGKIVDGAALECPYHGWTYGRDGRCILMPAHPEQAPPAKACVDVYRAAPAHDVIWVTLGDGASPIPTFELLEDPAYQVLLAGPYRVNASGPRVVENFLDVGHFPFVHEGILGDRSPRSPTTRLKSPPAAWSRLGSKSSSPIPTPRDTGRPSRTHIAFIDRFRRP